MVRNPLDLFRTLPPPEEERDAARERRRMLWRALRGRCPLCATPGLRSGWGAIRERCPGCNLHFARERGYLIGAAWFNLSVTLLALLVVLVAGPALLQPDVPWVVLGAVAAAVAVLVPVATLPLSMTLFLWLDLAYFRPLDADDLAANDADDQQA